MLKTNFKTKQEAEDYLKAEKILIENKQSTLSYSERQKIINNSVKSESLIIEIINPKLPIVTNIRELRNPCVEVTKEDNIKEIIQKLKDTLDNRGGLGISANQIGIPKKISYIKYPKMVDKKMEYTEIILINTKIIEKDNPIKMQNEECLSLPGLSLTTKRYVFLTVENYNEKLEPQTFLTQDFESIIIQHEHDHQNGRLILDRKWRTR